ncbi:MAG: hypothetical protein FJZ96_04315 [Chloroflexi bacterium]|nr:hypothetical protein [Chloroflexota bacterium]
MNSKLILSILVILTLLSSITLTACCWASELAFPPQLGDEIVKISGDFGLTTWSYGGYVLVGNYSDAEQRYVAVEGIVEIGWNNDFIIIKNNSHDYPWHVIIVTTNQNFPCGVENPLIDLGACISYDVVADLNLPDKLDIQMKNVQDVFESLKPEQP